LKNRTGDPSVREELRRERDLIARIMETSPAGITVVDRQGQIIFANARAVKVLGLTKDEITQRSYDAPEWHITDLDGNPFPDSELPFRQVMSTGCPVFDVRHAIEWPDGRRVLLSINAAPLIDETGELDGMVATVEDITELRQVQEAMLRTSRLEATATLARGIAHDFNNLMVGVLGYTEMLEIDLADREDALDMLRIIKTAATRASDLARQMLAYARGGKYQPTVLNPRDIILGVLRAREHDVPKGVRVALDVDPDLWDVQADRAQMSEVILNLFTNALEAIADRGRITFAASNVQLQEGAIPGMPTGDYVRLAVHDTGCGMSEDVRARVFEPFFTTKFLGRGMGLAAVYGIVENHGGHISVESQEGLGSTFTVHLPTTQKVDPADELHSDGATG
jgi:PAS domain S-box-containing protein